MDIFSIAILLWFIAAVFWFISAFYVKETQKSDVSLQRVLYILIWITAFYTMFSSHLPFSFLYQPFFLQQQWWKITGLICNIAGLTYTVWARATLGKNWSGRVTIKKNHELIQSGPYRITRHPIYSGMLLAFAGLSFISGEAHGYIAFPILFVGMMIKIIQEEKFMREAFGEHYLEYSVKVKRLIPFVF